MMHLRRRRAEAQRDPADLMAQLLAARQAADVEAEQQGGGGGSGGVQADDVGAEDDRGSGAGATCGPIILLPGPIATAGLDGDHATAIEDDLGGTSGDGATAWHGFQPGMMLLAQANGGGGSHGSGNSGAASDVGSDRCCDDLCITGAALMQVSGGDGMSPAGAHMSDKLPAGLGSSAHAGASLLVPAVNDDAVAVDEDDTAGSQHMELMSA